MLEYKTTCIPSSTYKNATKKEFERGLSVETANKALSPVGMAIQNEAKGGWTLHSIELLSQKIARKKTIFEKLLGWIPIVNLLFFPTMRRETTEGYEFFIYTLVFVRES